MSEKNQYLSRKEFLELCGITKNTLVWYEKMGLVRPKVIGENGYHYYSIEQFFEIDLIKSLKWTNKSLSACKEYVDTRSPDRFLDMLLEQQVLLEQQIEVLERQKKVVNQSLRDFLHMRGRYTTEPKLVECPDVYLLTQKIEENTPRGYVIALSKLFELFHGIVTTYDFSTSMYNRSLVTREDLLAGNYQTASYVCIRGTQYIDHPACRTIPAGTFVVCFHTGPVGSIGQTYERIMGFIQQENMEMAGDALESDYINYLLEKDSNGFSRELLIPVRRRKS